jgi:hypothetical protein
MERQFNILKLYIPIRGHILDALEDGDLDFEHEKLGPLSDIFIQIGEWQAAYLAGFQTFTQDFSYRNDVPKRQNSVALLRAWYDGMDEEIEAAIEAMSAEDIENRGIERGGWQASVEWNLRIWQECLLISYTKATFYFKLMGKELPDSLVKWIE